MLPLNADYKMVQDKMQIMVIECRIKLFSCAPSLNLKLQVLHAEL